MKRILTTEIITKWC